MLGGVAGFFCLDNSKELNLAIKDGFQAIGWFIVFISMQLSSAFLRKKLGEVPDIPMHPAMKSIFQATPTLSLIGFFLGLGNDTGLLRVTVLGFISLLLVAVDNVLLPFMFLILLFFGWNVFRAYGLPEIRMRISSSKGTIEVNLQRFNYLPGETITGKISLRVNQPRTAKGMRVRLLAEEFVYLSGNISSSWGWIPISEASFGSEGIYSNSEYSFEIGYPKSEEILQKILRIPEGEPYEGAAKEAMRNKLHQVRIEIEVTLIIPYSSPITTKVPLNPKLT